MTIEECKIAGRARIPVVHNGITYRRISSINLEFPEDNCGRMVAVQTVSVILEDKSGRSYTSVHARNVQPADYEAFLALASEAETSGEGGKGHGTAK